MTKRLWLRRAGLVLVGAALAGAPLGFLLRDATDKRDEYRFELVDVTDALEETEEDLDDSNDAVEELTAQLDESAEEIADLTDDVEDLEDDLATADSLLADFSECTHVFMYEFLPAALQGFDTGNLGEEIGGFCGTVMGEYILYEVGVEVPD